jgi:hypothetical protein
MREDMAKVIVERPRIKPWGTRKGRRIDPDDLPSHEGMRRGRALHDELTIQKKRICAARARRP